MSPNAVADLTPRQAAVAVSTFDTVTEHVIEEGPEIDVDGINRRYFEGILHGIAIHLRLSREQVVARPAEDVIEWIKAAGYKKSLPKGPVSEWVGRWAGDAGNK